jgi:hypothetical protein
MCNSAWGFSSVVEHLPTIYEALGLTPTPAKRKEIKRIAVFKGNYHGRRNLGISWGS